MMTETSDAPAAVLFDIDGTLVDSSYFHTIAWWEALRQHGYTVNMAEIHRAVGMGSDKLLDHLLPERGRDDDERLVAAHLALYGVSWPRLVPLRAAVDLLRACAAHDLRVVLASSASAREMAVLRSVLDADDVIDAATSSAEADASKPAPDIVRAALDRASVEPSRAVFVGDTVWDVESCRGAGVRCVGVLTGGFSAAELREAGAVAVYRDPAHLLDELEDSPLTTAV
jgi:HAD superfamily hydrolase (TIGR01509 family)